MRDDYVITFEPDAKTIELCVERLKKAGVHPSELSHDGLKLLLACAKRDRLAALRTH